MKKNKQKLFLDELRKLPIILVAAEKSGISRQTVYRWKEKDEKFLKEMEEAMKEGEEFVNDMSESQLLTLIKEKNWSAISFWLKHHHSAYRTRVEVTTVSPQEELTPEQEEIVREALKLASLPINSIDENEKPTKTTNAPEGTNGENDEGSNSENGNNQV